MSKDIKFNFLNSDEEERYQKHLTLKEIGYEGQINLKNSSVLCIGAGGLGSSVLLYLAAAGIGRIGIVDNDQVEKSNLQRQIIHETDLANNFSIYFQKFKKKLSKYMQDAISNGNKYTAKEYAEAIDFMKRSYESYEEVFEDYHGVLSPSSPGVAPKGLKSTGTAEFNKVWSYLGTPCISLPLLEGENNLPLGVQLIGDRYDDHRFLGVANWLEKECNN